MSKKVSSCNFYVREKQSDSDNPLRIVPFFAFAFEALDDAARELLKTIEAVAVLSQIDEKL